MNLGIIACIAKARHTVIRVISLEAGAYYTSSMPLNCIGSVTIDASKRAYLIFSVSF